MFALRACAHALTATVLNTPPSNVPGTSQVFRAEVLNGELTLFKVRRALDIQYARARYRMPNV